VCWSGCAAFQARKEGSIDVLEKANRCGCRCGHRIDVLTASSAVSATAAPPADSLSTDISSHAFGDTRVGQTSSDTVTFTVSFEGMKQGNSGKLLIAVGGKDSDDFIITETTCKASLKDGQSCMIDVAFHPANHGLRTGVLEIGSVRSSTHVTDADLSLSGVGTGGGLGFPEESVMNFDVTQYPCPDGSAECFGYVSGSGNNPSPYVVADLNLGDPNIGIGWPNTDGKIGTNVIIPCRVDTGALITYPAIYAFTSDADDLSVIAARNFTCITE
jgi:hypothetical protein